MIIMSAQFFYLLQPNHKQNKLIVFGDFFQGKTSKVLDLSCFNDQIYKLAWPANDIIHDVILQRVNGKSEWQT